VTTTPATTAAPPIKPEVDGNFSDKREYAEDTDSNPTVYDRETIHSPRDGYCAKRNQDARCIKR